jgi:chemotaxis protein methyltransferase WspC
MPPTDIELLLKKRMGLDVASVGRSSIERAVAQRMTECGAGKVAEYARLAAGSEKELQELIEAVVVPETWFFRDREAFSALAQLAITEWLPANTNRTARLLSIPCSTGEEPYSIAMALRDAGVPLERVHIDAVDISTLSLQSAEAGIYRKNSFRGDSLEFRNRHFTAGRDCYHIRKDIQRHVHFRKGNLLDEGFLAGNAPYDFMFCRNLLIYFDEETQNCAVTTLKRLLSERGLLFIGPSESGLFLRHDFVSARIPLAFAFRKSSEHGEAQHSQTERPRKKAPRLFRAPALPARALTPKKPSALSQTSPALVIAAPSLLRTAAKLADEGRLAEAAQFCEEHLREHGSSTQAYYLLGLVRDNAGQPEEARKFYRKVLFLDPGHYEALLHFGFLARKCGDESEARALLERARRVNKKIMSHQNGEFRT